MKIALVFSLLLSATAFLHGADAKRAANTVVLDATGVKNLRIETVEVEETDFEETVFTLGHIEILPGNRAVLSSRIPGRAFSVLAIPDQNVEKGDELMWVESRQPGDPPPVIKLTAPMAGTIAKVDVATGQPVSPDQSLMEIVNLSQVEAAAQVPEHLVGKLAVGQVARIRVPAFPDKPFEAKLAHLGVLGNSENGTVEAAFHLANPDTLLRPGMRAEFSIVLSKREDVVSIPRTALQGEASSRFVYVKDFDLPNAFVKTLVQVGQMNERFVEITSGLLPADEVVTRGAYSLSFAGGGSVSLKEALDAAHGHEHAADGSELTPEKKAEMEKAKRAAAGGGHDHGHEEAAGIAANPLWMYATLVLGVLLLISLIFRKSGAEPEAEDILAPPVHKQHT